MLFPLFVSIEMYEKYEKLVHQLSVCALYDIETRQQNVGLIVNFLISRQILRWSALFFPPNPDWHKAGRIYPPYNFWIGFCQLNFLTNFCQKIQESFGGENWDQSG